MLRKFLFSNTLFSSLHVLKRVVRLLCLTYCTSKQNEPLIFNQIYKLVLLKHAVYRLCHCGPDFRNKGTNLLPLLWSAQFWHLTGSLKIELSCLELLPRTHGLKTAAPLMGGKNNGTAIMPLPMTQHCFKTADCCWGL